VKKELLGSGAAVLLALAVGCANGSAQNVLRLQNDIVFEAVDGQAVLRITRDGEDVRVLDGAGVELLRLVLEGDRIAILNAGGSRIGEVRAPSLDGAGYRVVADGESAPVFELRPEPDGDFKVIDRGRATVYQAKLRDYGFKIVDGDGEVRSRVRSKGTKTSLRDRSGVTFMTTRDALSTASAAALALEDLRFAYAVALSVALVQWEPGAERSPRSSTADALGR